MSELNEHLLSFLAQHLVDRCLVACSGGVDSMVLLDLLIKSGIEVKVLHVNYGLRGESSDLDEQVIRTYCEQHQLALEVLRVDLYSDLKQQGGNLQQKARDIRYAFFANHLKEGDGVFLAHHLDDQIETFFLGLSRGGGIRALSCMAEHRGTTYRPLLRFSKKELIRYAEEQHLPWREDQSNQELSYARNKWRNVFLPELEKTFPDLRSAIPMLVLLFQERLKLVQQKAGEFKESFMHNDTLPFTWFEEEEGEVVAELLRLLGFHYSIHEELRKLMHAEKGAHLKPSHTNYQCIYRESDHFFFVKDTALQVPELIIAYVDVLPANFDKMTLYLDPDKIAGKLKIRPWQPGDRIKPIGLKGSKLISDVLSDAKVPAHQKGTQLVLHDDKKILWCIGYTVSREAVATPFSKKVKVTLRGF
jgi:tRNA(Ile)-lysidine synthase